MTLIICLHIYLGLRMGANFRGCSFLLLSEFLSLLLNPRRSSTEAGRASNATALGRPGGRTQCSETAPRRYCHYYCHYVVTPIVTTPCDLFQTGIEEFWPAGDISFLLYSIGATRFQRP
jgi:hypothetical protein